MTFGEGGSRRKALLARAVQPAQRRGDLPWPRNALAAESRRASNGETPRDRVMGQCLVEPARHVHLKRHMLWPALICATACVTRCAERQASSE